LIAATVHVLLVALVFAQDAVFVLSVALVEIQTSRLEQLAALAGRVVA